MIVETHFALVDEILAGWKSRIGDDYAGYRNHLYRVLNFCFALRDCDAEERHKLTVAAAFHDLGIWSEGTVDYLAPSVALAKSYLENNNLDRWTDEISLIIDMHHKLRRFRDGRFPLVEVFRRGDLIDFSLGVVKFDLPRRHVSAVKGAIPNEGFHKRLLQLAGGWFASHPLSPPPFMKW